MYFHIDLFLMELPRFFVWLASTIFVSKYFPDLIKLILQKDKLMKFKKIFDNLDETIMIVNQNDFSLEYMNIQFYLQFKEMIQQFPDSQDFFDPKNHEYFLDMKIFETYKQ